MHCTARPYTAVRCPPLLFPVVSSVEVSAIRTTAPASRGGRGANELLDVFRAASSTVQGTLYIVQYSVQYTVQCTLYSVQSTINSLQSTVQCILYTVQNSVQYTVDCTLHCTVYSSAVQ